MGVRDLFGAISYHIQLIELTLNSEFIVQRDLLSEGQDSASIFRKFYGERKAHG